MQSINLHSYQSSIGRDEREMLNGHRGCVVWFTGLSGSGKSTLAHAIEERLYKAGCHTFVLDGDNIRQGLCSDLDFSPSSRTENIRRIGEVARLFMDAGVIVLTAFISPFRSDREQVRRLAGAERFFEIFCDCPIDICESRDVKGLYAKARRGEVREFTGISSAYEPPLEPELAVQSGQCGIDECVGQIIAMLAERRMLPEGFKA